MINAKSNSVEKNLLVDNDLTFTKPSISPDSKVKAMSNGFVMYNKYEAIFSGYLEMKAGVVNADEVLLTLPFKLKYPNAYLIGRLSGNTMTFYVDQNGRLIKQTAQTFEDGDLIFIVGSFAISNGGGFLTTFFKKLRAFFLGKEAAYA